MTLALLTKSSRAKKARFHRDFAVCRGCYSVQAVRYQDTSGCFHSQQCKRNPIYGGSLILDYPRNKTTPQLTSVWPSPQMVLMLRFHCKAFSRKVTHFSSCYKVLYIICTSIARSSQQLQRLELYFCMNQCTWNVSLCIRANKATSILICTCTQPVTSSQVDWHVSC